jgi:hypothetical protein
VFYIRIPRRLITIDCHNFVTTEITATNPMTNMIFKCVFHFWTEPQMNLISTQSQLNSLRMVVLTFKFKSNAQTNFNLSEWKSVYRINLNKNEEMILKRIPSLISQILDPEEWMNHLTNKLFSLIFKSRI